MAALNPLSPKFHDSTLHHDVKFGFQALAIDEQRWPFEPKLWNESKKDPNQTIEQVWFAGVHSDIGGTYKECGLSNITLRWMIDKAVERDLILKKDYEKNIEDLLINDSVPLTEKLWLKTRRLLGRPSKPNQADKLHNSRSGLAWFYPKKTREIPKGAKIHESVCERAKDPAKKYTPSNLPNLIRVNTEATDQTDLQATEICLTS